MQNFSLKQSVINKPIQVSDVLSILHRYGLPPHIHNLSLYQQAFIHTSAFNQRVEFLGDALLNAISSVFLYMKYKHHDEGFLTQKRQKVVNNEFIGKLAIDVLGLQQYIILSEEAEKQQLRENVNYMGNQFEAFLGAMFLDFNKTTLLNDTEGHHDLLMSYGFQMVQIFITNLFNEHVDFENLARDYKGEVNDRVQSVFRTKNKLLHYITLSQEQLNPGCEYMQDKWRFTIGLFYIPSTMSAKRIDLESYRKGQYRSIDEAEFGSLEAIRDHINQERNEVQRKDNPFVLAVAVDSNKKKAEKLCAQQLIEKLTPPPPPLSLLPHHCHSV